MHSPEVETYIKVLAKLNAKFQGDREQFATVLTVAQGLQKLFPNVAEYERTRNRHSYLGGPKEDPKPIYRTEPYEVHH